MRTIGVAVLGLFAGLLAGLVLWEIVGVALLGLDVTADFPGPVIVLLRAVTPLCGIAGAIIAVAMERRNRSRS